MSDFPRGSEWRKWDLQVHAPGAKHADQYKAPKGTDPWDLFLAHLQDSDVTVFGITDYFSIDSYEELTRRVAEDEELRQRTFLPCVELRLDISANRAGEEVNLNLIFDPDRDPQDIKNFLSHLDTTATKPGGAHYRCTSGDLAAVGYEGASIELGALKTALSKTFGKEKPYLVAGSYRGFGGYIYGHPEKGGESKRKKLLSDEVDKFCDLAFGNSSDAEWFARSDRYEDKNTSSKVIPVLSTSDSHSFDDLAKALGKQRKDGDRVISDVTWIKANPTYEGLKQILYEPLQGDRVRIDPRRPDEKPLYKVIKQIRFTDSADFPAAILFNPSLSSIIGSRSSGKSALLAYVAHAVDRELAEELTVGPGDGEEYHWDAIDESYEVDWANDEPNSASQGKVVYIPQGHLYETSKDPEKIKKRIEPVLFAANPTFREEYRRVERDVGNCNRKISGGVETWFANRNELDGLDAALKNHGEKSAVEKELTAVQGRIEDLKERAALSEDEIAQYEMLKSEIATLEERQAEIRAALSDISSTDAEPDFFDRVEIETTPGLGDLPGDLQEKLTGVLEQHAEATLNDLNKDVLSYARSLAKEAETGAQRLTTIRKENHELFEKYKKNAELEDLMTEARKHSKTLKKITDLEVKRKAVATSLPTLAGALKTDIARRYALIESLPSMLSEEDQEKPEEIAFGVESAIGAGLEKLTEKLNVKHKTDFVENRIPNLEYIREHPGEFLEAIHCSSQKVMAGLDPNVVAREALTLTEKVLFYAEMEGDRIGGLTEPTMTPGKRALFALRLILAESAETWPLLIDQPEDDLDSRSIYDDIVPFLRMKKRERQIIMVSHNANLVIGADSEAIIVANRHGEDRPNADGKQFNYSSGGIEDTKPRDARLKDTLGAQGIREHACEILDGGIEAFEKRRNKYSLDK